MNFPADFLSQVKSAECQGRASGGDSPFTLDFRAILWNEENPPCRVSFLTLFEVNFFYCILSFYSNLRSRGASPDAVSRALGVQKSCKKYAKRGGKMLASCANLYQECRFLLWFCTGLAPWKLSPQKNRRPKKKSRPQKNLAFQKKRLLSKKKV